MDIICATDFSDPAASSADVAVSIARSINAPLRLVYVIDRRASSGMLGGALDLVAASIRDRLSAEGQRLRDQGVEVREELLDGVPDEELIRISGEAKNGLIILSSTGWRSTSFWTLGSVAEKTARGAKCPVLVVRNRESLLAWTSGKKPLEVMVGIDRSSASETAVRWISELRRIGPCNVRFAHVFSPVEEMPRYGFRGSIVEEDPRLHRSMLEDLEKLVTAAGETSPRILLRANLGRPADALIAIAGEESVDLLVVATRELPVVERAKRGSVSYTALHMSPTSVATIPAGVELSARSLPRLESIVAASDGSEGGRSAVCYAMAIAPAGSKVHVICVVPKGTSEEDRQASSRLLLEGIPQDSTSRTEVEVVESDHVANAICQAAERLHADVICIASRGRSAALRTILGSVSEAVARNSRRTVLIVHPGQK